MERNDRRRRDRIDCTTLARFSVGGALRAALTVDLSLDGLGLRGAELPPAGTALELALLASPSFVVRTRVRWVDPARRAAGLAIARGAPQPGADVARGLLSLAFEAECERPAVALLVEDLELAARLCAPIRRTGFVPRVFRAPLDAIAALGRDRPPIRVAIVSRAVWGATAEELLALLAASYPAVRRIALGAPAPEHAELALPLDGDEAGGVEGVEAIEGVEDALGAVLARLAPLPPRVPVDTRRRDTRRTRSLSRGAK